MLLFFFFNEKVTISNVLNVYRKHIFIIIIISCISHKISQVTYYLFLINKFVYAYIRCKIHQLFTHTTSLLVKKLGR